MKNLYARVTTYNLINIVSTITLLIVQYLNFTVLLRWYSFYLDDNIMAILFWPLALLGLIVRFNMSSLKKFIHRENIVMYQANNVNTDLERDNGSIPVSALDALPKSSIADAKIKCEVDLEYFGALDDIGINYKLDAFKYQVYRKQRSNKKTRTVNLGKISGEALTIKLPKKRFGSEWILYVNDKVKISNIIFAQRHQEPVGAGSHSGRILYNTDDKPHVDYIRDVINKNPDIFVNRGKVITMFKRDTFILITTKGSRFSIRVPLLITKSRLEQLVSEQKAQIYRFNQSLVDLSRIFNLETHK